MISLKINGSKKSPNILFEPFSGEFSIKGRSNLENPSKFYESVLRWLNKYVANPAMKTTVNVELEYFNSASSKLLMKSFRILESIHGKDHRKVAINWWYHSSDGSMKEAGEDFKSMLKLNFQFKDLDKK